MPPMLRQVPYWYSRYHDTVMSVFEDVFRSSTVESVYVLPSPPVALAYERDCVHLTEESGPM
jgi:hypothetical protein